MRRSHAHRLCRRRYPSSFSETDDDLSGCCACGDRRCTVCRDCRNNVDRDRRTRSGDRHSICRCSLDLENREFDVGRVRSLTVEAQDHGEGHPRNPDDLRLGLCLRRRSLAGCLRVRARTMAGMLDRRTCLAALDRSHVRTRISEHALRTHAALARGCHRSRRSMLRSEEEGSFAGHRKLPVDLQVERIPRALGMLRAGRKSRIAAVLPGSIHGPEDGDDWRWGRSSLTPTCRMDLPRRTYDKCVRKQCQCSL